jgi:hypothetical protein
MINVCVHKCHTQGCDSDSPCLSYSFRPFHATPYSAALTAIPVCRESYPRICIECIVVNIRLFFTEFKEDARFLFSVLDTRLS